MGWLDLLDSGRKLGAHSGVIPPPTQLMFEGVTGSTAYLDISLDAIYIRRGSCSKGEHLSLLLFLSTPIIT